MSATIIPFPPKTPATFDEAEDIIEETYERYEARYGWPPKKGAPPFKAFEVMVERLRASGLADIADEIADKYDVEDN